MEQNNPLFIAFQQGYARRNSNNFSRDWDEFKTNHADLFHPPSPAKADQEGPWKYEVHHDLGPEDTDEWVTITDGRVTLRFDQHEDEEGEEKVVALLNQLKAKISFHDNADIADYYKEQLDELRAQQKQEGLRWVKATMFNYKPNSRYYARWGDRDGAIKSTGWFQQSDGTFFWNENGFVPVLKKEHDQLYILDESTTPPVKEVAYDELWDEFSEYIDDDIDSLSIFAGRTVLTEAQYNKLVAKLKAAPVNEAGQPRNLPIEELIKLSDEELNVEINKVRSRLGMGKSEEARQPADDKIFDEDLAYELMARFVANSGKKDSIKKIRKEAFVDGALWAKKYLESRQQPAGESALTPEDIDFMKECNVIPHSNLSAKIITENDEGSYLTKDDLLQLSDILYRYAKADDQSQNNKP